MSNTWKEQAGVPTPAGGRLDSRPLSVRNQDAAILEYAVRNRLLRGPGPTTHTRGDAQAPEAPRAERRRRRRRSGATRAAARAERIYRRIAPPAQKYPLQAVTIIRRLLDEGALEEFVQGTYQTHVRCCGEFGVPSMPLIPYLAELLEVFLLDSRAARRRARLRSQFVT